MLPLRDNIPSRTTPVVNYVMIAACTLAFLFQVSRQDDPNAIVEQYGMIPFRVLHPGEPIVLEETVAYYDRRTGRRVAEETIERPLAETPFAPWFTLLTCMFLHGGWLHFVGNMWFLIIFGDNVEDRLGHAGYLLFYLSAGVLAGVAHLATNSASTVPTIGASGAISGVMGAYFVLYPKAMVLAVVPIIVYLHFMVLPAPVFLGVWFLLQLFQGTISVTGGEAAGVAFWAHVGGFVFGLAAAGLCRAVGLCRGPVFERRPNSDYVKVIRLRP